MANIFISFKGVDVAYREGLEGLLRNPNNTFTHVPLSTREDKRHGGGAAIQEYLRTLIRDAHVVVCLIGANTHQSSWVDYELQVAKSWGIPIVAVALPWGAGPNPGPIVREERVEWAAAERAVESAVSRGRVR